MNVLLLEADSITLAHLGRIVAACGHTVFSHQDSSAASEVFLASRPHVVIVDASSEEAAGVAFCREIRRTAGARQPFIIALTSGFAAGSETPLLHPEADDVLRRPITEEAVSERLAVAALVLHRRNEEARELDQLRRIREESPDPILLLGPNGELLYANPASAPLLEASEAHPGSPAPSALRDLARAAAAGTRITSKIHRFESSWEIVANPVADGIVCLYGHEAAVKDRFHPANGDAHHSGSEPHDVPPDTLSGNPLFHRLQQALREKRLQVQYQPLISAKHDRVEGFEALARWHDPEMGWVSPERFIPMAEARGLIVELGRQLADISFRQLSIWRDAGHHVGISVNVSKRQLQEPGFCEEMRELARVHRLTVDWITFEVTERQSLLHDATCRAALEQLGAAGFRLSLDDFGSGHSAFDMVAEIAFRELKIDMGLCRQARSARSQPIAQAIIDMCQTLELDSVAEGIEDDKMLRLFADMGATLLQGYYYSPPMGGEAALQYLAAGKTRRET